MSPNTVFFSDRPERIAGHINSAGFVSLWAEGKDSFASGPRTATLSILGPGSATNVVGDSNKRGRRQQMKATSQAADRPRRNQMTNAFSFPRMLVTVALLATVPTAIAVSAEMTDEPDKTMAAAGDSLSKGDTKKAADYLHKSAEYVHKEADKVAKSAQAGVKKAGDDLDQLGQEVGKGTVKSGDKLKQTFAKVDHELAKAWYATATEAKKAGKDSSEMLKKSGAALGGAAHWSGAKLKEGANMAVEGAKKIGQGTKAGADEVEKMFKNLGEGIQDLGHHL